MSDGERCGHPREGKDPCGSAIGLCDDCGHCWQHCDHVSKEERAEARRKGGQTTARQRKTHDGIEAPWELETVEDAKAWLARIGRLVLENEISAKQAHASIRSVEAWLDAEKDAEGWEDLRRAKEIIEAAKNRGNMEAV